DALRRRPESLEVRGDAVLADADGNAIAAALVGDRNEVVAGRGMDRGDGDTGQHAAAAVRNGAGQGGFLREAATRTAKHEERAEHQDTSDHTSTVHGWLLLGIRDSDSGFVRLTNRRIADAARRASRGPLRRAPGFVECFQRSKRRGRGGSAITAGDSPSFVES